MAHLAETLKLKAFFKNRYKKEQEQHGDLSQLKNNRLNDAKVQLQCQVFTHVYITLASERKKNAN